MIEILRRILAKFRRRQETAEERAERLEDLRVLALGFYRTGGVLSLGDYADMAFDERLVFAEAFAVVETERAARLGLASQSLEGLAEVISEIDDGRSRDLLRARRILDEMPDPLVDEDAA